jgi:hypothetical protein
MSTLRGICPSCGGALWLEHIHDCPGGKRGPIGPVLSARTGVWCDRCGYQIADSIAEVKDWITCPNCDGDDFSSADHPGVYTRLAESDRTIRRLHDAALELQDELTEAERIICEAAGWALECRIGKRHGDMREVLTILNQLNKRRRAAREAGE